MNAASFARLISVAEHPELSSLVRSVTVFPKQVQKADLSREDYDHHLTIAQYGDMYKRYRQFKADVSLLQKHFHTLLVSFRDIDMWREQSVQDICLAG